MKTVKISDELFAEMKKCVENGCFLLIPSYDVSLIVATEFDELEKKRLSEISGKTNAMTPISDEIINEVNLNLKNGEKRFIDEIQ